MEYKELSLEEHQQILYEIVYMLDDFFKKYGIKYWLLGGTLLGAIRHQGIIPWDDDADIAMERSEYEKFIKLFRENTPSGYCMYTIEDTKGYYYPFAKIGKIGTHLVEPLDYLPKEGLCINVDIIPMDGCPGELEEARQYFETYREGVVNRLWCWCSAKLSNFKTWKEKLHFIKYSIPYFKHRMFLSYYSEPTQYPIKENKYFACMCWGIYGAKKEVLPSEYVSSFVTAKFGERDLPVPKHYHEYLSTIYGDYMTPIKNREHKRVGTSYLIIKN